MLIFRWGDSLDGHERERQSVDLFIENVCLTNNNIEVVHSAFTIKYCTDENKYISTDFRFDNHVKIKKNLDEKRFSFYLWTRRTVPTNHKSKSTFAFAGSPTFSELWQ